MTTEFEINLDIIVDQLVARQGWSQSKANQIKQEYIQFWQEIRSCPEARKTEPPSKEVDDFWHQHILNTKKYVEDCEYYFGFFLHHVPSPVEPPQKTPRQRCSAKPFVCSGNLGGACVVFCGTEGPPNE